MKMLKRLFGGFLVLAMLLSITPAAAMAEAMGTTAEPVLMHSGDLNNSKPTKEQIRQVWDLVTNATDRYVTEPSISAPYALGELSESFLNSGLTYLNYVRYVAHLPAVQLTDEMNESAQYGAVVLASLDQFTHYPQKPDDMDEEFFQKGYAATTSSNISARWGYNELESLQSAVSGCMEDDSSLQNLTCVGHRRWLLNPVLRDVGFGYAKVPGSWSYVVTKVFDHSGPGVDYDFISWPASGNFPTNLFGTTVPWSVTLNQSLYQKPSKDQVKITITRQSDGKTWSFDGNTAGAVDNQTAYLEVNNQGYGVANCIIFHPGANNIDTYEGVFTVEVSGIFYRDGSAATIRYEVDFFDVSKVCLEHSYAADVTEPTCTTPGYTTYTCIHCGDSYAGDETPAKGHTPGEPCLEYDPRIHQYQTVVYCADCRTELSREHLRGDIDTNGRVNNHDLTRLFQYLSGYDVDVQEDALDINGDGVVNNKDLTRLFQHLSGWDVEIH